MDNSNQLVKCVVSALEEMKAQDITVIDVQGKTSIADFIFIATGTSSRHNKGIAEKVIEDAKGSGVRPLGVEGLDQPEWILVDLGDTIVHVMQDEIRKFYDLEQLWETGEAS